LWKFSEKEKRKMVREYTEEQKERKNEAKKKWYAENKERHNEARRKRYAENGDKQREASNQWRAANRDKKRETGKKWYAENRDKRREMRMENPEKYWETSIRSKYGLSREPVEAMYEAQGGKCKICGTPKWSPSALDVKAVDRLHIDHCHSTNAVRGLLCIVCNTTLGRIKDNISTLRNAILYLEESKGERS